MANGARRIRRTIMAAAFVMISAFVLTGAPAAAAGAPGIEVAGPRFTYTYFSGPDFQNQVGQRVVTRCPDIPIEEWGERTEWVRQTQDWVQCPV